MYLTGEQEQQTHNRMMSNCFHLQAQEQERKEHQIHYVPLSLQHYLEFEEPSQEQ